jgi:voltage-gated potassium channel
VSLLGEFVVTGVATGVWQRRSMDRSIAGMRGHHVICGFGRVGSRVAQRLEEAGERVVVIDGNPEALERAADRGLLFLDGKAVTVVERVSPSPDSTIQIALDSAART